MKKCITCSCRPFGTPECVETRELGHCTGIERECPHCGDPMTLEEHPTSGELYFECGFCDEMIPYEKS